MIRYGCLDVSISQDQPVQRLIIRPDRDLVRSRGQELLLETEAIEQYRRSLLVQYLQLLGVPFEEEVIEAPAVPKPPDFLRVGRDIECDPGHEDQIQSCMF